MSEKKQAKQAMYAQMSAMYGIPNPYAQQQQPKERSFMSRLGDGLRGLSMGMNMGMGLSQGNPYMGYPMNGTGYPYAQQYPWMQNGQFGFYG